MQLHASLSLDLHAAAHAAAARARAGQLHFQPAGGAGRGRSISRTGAAAAGRRRPGRAGAYTVGDSAFSLAKFKSIDACIMIMIAIARARARALALQVHVRARARKRALAITISISIARNRYPRNSSSSYVLSKFSYVLRTRAFAREARALYAHMTIEPGNLGVHACLSLRAAHDARVHAIAIG